MINIYENVISLDDADNLWTDLSTNIVVLKEH